ncbi:MAG: AAA family ATPase [Candidatus Micrarchaeales archaeon]
MADKGPSGSPADGKPKPSDKQRPRFSEEVIRRRRKIAPIGLYHIREKLLDITSTGSFVDAILILIAFVSVISFMGFYPIAIIIAILIVLFAVTLFQPFIGLVLFTVLVFPIYIYQTPLLAWSFFLAATFMLIYGYKHYRVAVFTYVLVGVAFSPFGYLFEIPLFIFAVLTIGNKRAIMSLVLSVLLIVMFSAVTGLQNTGYIAYNAQEAHVNLGASSPIASTIILSDVPSKPAYPFFNFSAGVSSSVSNFFGASITKEVPNAAQVLAGSFISDSMSYVFQTMVLIGLIIVIDMYATSSRSKYKGTYASLLGVIYPLSYIVFTITAKSLSMPNTYIMPFLSFIIAPAAFYMLEYYDINMVRVLDVKKQDIRMKFGEAFEDLAGGNQTETFDDIGNYDPTKRELKEAIILPIEERGVSHAYNIKPTKGVLFFGPPGTGKTMMMRALANEIHAGFFYVKATNLISAYPGESERLIINIFNIAKKNAPCVLFFDEIDSLALSRENPSIDDTHRHVLSQLLSEMDGFQKVKGVIVVGATNRPDLLDKAIIRPGRFDKLIYMPLPDFNGRKKIFKIYLEKLPVSSDINLNQLAEKTERYSGADIKGVCETIAQIIAQEATSEHKVLEINQVDILGVIKSSKPSTSLSQLDDYRKFKLDFERSMFPAGTEEVKKEIGMDDIIGLESAKKAIREAVQIPLTHPELVKKYDIKPVSGLLLFGPPGNGKTMLMRAVNNDIKGITMLELSGSELAEAGIERATATIKEIFNRAKENSPAIIFIDELDGVLPKREGASEIGVQITSEMLKEIDGIKQLSNVVVVGATNRPDELDPAILRPGRFDKLIFIKPPGATNRSELFKKYLANVPCVGIDYQKLGAETKGFTGADIANVCREGKTHALQDELNTGVEGKITMEVLENVIKRVKPSAPESVINQYLSFLEKYGQR